MNHMKVPLFRLVKMSLSVTSMVHDHVCESSWLAGSRACLITDYTVLCLSKVFCALFLNPVVMILSHFRRI